MFSFRSLYIIHSELLLVLHFSLFVYIKSFKELSSSVLPFHRESVCKDKADFSIHQIFFEVFFRKKNFARTAEAISRSLACLQDKILFTVPAVLRMSSLLAFSLESGCKGTHFFLSGKHINRFFLNKF